MQVGGARRPPRLLDQMRERMRRLGLSIRTEEVYVGWVRRFILANAKRHPRDMGAREVERFLTCLATQGHVSASTQNQALSALLFLYREVLQRIAMDRQHPPREATAAAAGGAES